MVGSGSYISDIQTAWNALSIFFLWNRKNIIFEDFVEFEDAPIVAEESSDVIEIPLNPSIKTLQMKYDEESFVGEPPVSIKKSKTSFNCLRIFAKRCDNVYDFKF